MTDSANKAIERVLELDVIQANSEEEQWRKTLAQVELIKIKPRLAKALKIAMEALESRDTGNTDIKPMHRQYPSDESGVTQWYCHADCSACEALSQIEKVFNDD
jgi:hypothetical protein